MKESEREIMTERQKEKLGKTEQVMATWQGNSIFCYLNFES